MRKLSKEEFLAKINKKIEVKGVYSGYRSNVLVKCLICSNEWTTKAGILCNGCGCPNCGQKKAKETRKWSVSQEQFLNKIPSDFLKKIEVLSDYTSQHCDIEVKCKKCDRHWISTPYYLYREYGCEVCKRKENGKKLRKSHDDFVKEVFDFHQEDVRVLSKYKTTKHRIKVSCTQCGHIWFPLPRNILRRGCPMCVFPKGEKKVASILEELNVDYKRQYVFEDLYGAFGGKLRFDFAIMENNSLKTLIEYDGMQHFKPIKYMGGIERFERQKLNDNLKNEYCRQHGIKLIRISYKEELEKEKIRLLLKSEKA